MDSFIDQTKKTRPSKLVCHHVGFVFGSSFKRHEWLWVEFANPKGGNFNGQDLQITSFWDDDEEEMEPCDWTIPLKKVKILLRLNLYPANLNGFELNENKGKQKKIQNIKFIKNLVDFGVQWYYLVNTEDYDGTISTEEPSSDENSDEASIGYDTTRRTRSSMTKNKTQKKTQKKSAKKTKDKKTKEKKNKSETAQKKAKDVFEDASNETPSTLQMQMENTSEEPVIVSEDENDDKPCYIHHDKKYSDQIKFFEETELPLDFITEVNETKETCKLVPLKTKLKGQKEGEIVWVKTKFEGWSRERYEEKIRVNAKVWSGDEKKNKKKGQPKEIRRNEFMKDVFKNPDNYRLVKINSSDQKKIDRKFKKANQTIPFTFLEFINVKKDNPFTGKYHKSFFFRTFLKLCLLVCFLCLSFTHF